MTAPSPSAARPVSAPFPGVTLLIALAAVGLNFWPAAGRDFFFERDALRAGEFWRLWTAHLVHFGTSHLFWNLAVLIPSAGWSERLAPARARLLLLLEPPFISGALFAVDPALQRYGGLSGLAAAMLAFLALTQLGRGSADRWFWRAVLALLALKIVVELLADRPAFSRFIEAGTYTVPMAHIAGVLAAWLAYRIQRDRRVRQP